VYWLKLESLDTIVDKLHIVREGPTQNPKFDSLASPLYLLERKAPVHYLPSMNVLYLPAKQNVKSQHHNGEWNVSLVSQSRKKTRGCFHPSLFVGIVYFWTLDCAKISGIAFGSVNSC